MDDTNYKDEWFFCTNVNIGISSDDYTEGCSCAGRSSYRYANKFYDTLFESMGQGLLTKTHHYNNDAVKTASKNDFSSNGAISDNFDFMIYIGHGHAADDAKGNHIHFSCSNGIANTTNDCEIEAYNAYTSDIKFGSSTSDLRWVWMYTCNFLTTGEYVTEDSLKEMMNGAHIVMGYASKATLCDAMAETFADYLRRGIPIFDAYFKAGHDGEGGVEPLDHYQRVLYIPQARYETIYSPAIYFEYEPSDVLIYTHNIHDPYGFE